MERIIRTLIADDELYSRDELRHLLEQNSRVEVIGEAESGEGAILKAIELQPDVVFLDIEMPRMNGMEAARSLQELKKPPVLVFATAYPNFAAEAFRYEALDYLLKPYDSKQIQETVQRLYKLFALVPAAEDQRRTGKLAVELSGDIVYLEPKDILYIVHEEKASKITTIQAEYSTKIPLKDLESRLSSYSFFRIHKSYLVNIDYVKRLTPWFNGAYQLELEGVKEHLSVSRNYVKPLRTRLEI
jgi:two-component system response regulator LytT